MNFDKALIISSLLCLVVIVNSLSLYSWIQTGEKFCRGNATKQQTQALMKCDKVMREERRKLLETCLREKVNYKLTDDKPRVCSYFNNEKDFTVMECMHNKTFDFYGSKFKPNRDEQEIDEIDAVENQFDWCIMKSVSLHGFEHLCDMQLNDKQIRDMKGCKNYAKEIIGALDECRAEAKLNNDKRPSICDYYENIRIQKCWIKKSNKWGESDKTNNRNKYIECLSKIRK